MSNTTTPEVQVKKTDFTPYERNSVYCEIIMQESPKINSVMDLYEFLHREKARIYKVLLKGDSLDKLVLTPELAEISRELKDIEEYFELLTKN